MEIAYSILIVVGSFVFFVATSFLLFKLIFPKIENDDWEEHYVQMKHEAKRLAQLRKPEQHQKAIG